MLLIHGNVAATSHGDDRKFTHMVPQIITNENLQDDLRQYHAAHFPNAPSPESYLHGAVAEAAQEEEATQEEYTYEDESLGYYEDGTERTLTDEQIAMFRHTEIQTILRDRRRRREEGEPLHAIYSPRSPPSKPEVSDKRELGTSASPPEHSTPTLSTPGTNKVQSGRVEKPKQQWTAVGEKSRARNAKNRKKNRANHRARKKEEQKKQDQEMLKAEESDEWDPWHQANGPDVQKDTTVDLEY